MNNNGTQPWSTPRLYRLGSQNPQDNFRWGFNRVDLPVSRINPGQNAAFTFTATAPTNTGTFPFDWRMVQDAVEWFAQRPQHRSSGRVRACSCAHRTDCFVAATRKSRLAWTASSGATGYNVHRAPSSSGPYTQIATNVTSTTYTDAGLPNGTTYSMPWLPSTPAAPAALSAYAGATTIPAAPTGLSATPGNAQVALS